MVSGYVFARFTGVPNWDVIQSRPWFTGVITFNGMPWPFPRGDIRLLQGLTVAAEEHRAALRARQEAARAALMPVEGGKARMIKGPLQGFCVDVTRVSGGVIGYLLPNGVPGFAAAEMMERIAG